MPLSSLVVCVYLLNSPGVSFPYRLDSIFFRSAYFLLFCFTLKKNPKIYWVVTQIHNHPTYARQLRTFMFMFLSPGPWVWSSQTLWRNLGRSLTWSSRKGSWSRGYVPVVWTASRPWPSMRSTWANLFLSEDCVCVSGWKNRERERERECIYAHMLVCVCVCVHEYVYLFECVCICVYVCVYVYCVNMCVQICDIEYMCIHTCACMCVLVRVCVCVCVCVWERERERECSCVHACVCVCVHVCVFMCMCAWKFCDIWRHLSVCFK